MKPHPFTLQNPALLLNTEPGKWFVQRYRPGPFLPERRPMSQHDLDQVLEGRAWIASYAPPDGYVDRLEFDLDCKEPEGLPERDRRYWAIRGIVGMHHRPLVVLTPSGFGLHVSYRIPNTPLEAIVTGVNTGVVADTLRGAGLQVGNGAIEVYPQRRQCKRIPLGRRIAILDPDTLEPVVAAPDRPTVDSPQWEKFADLLADWHRCVAHGLIDHIRTAHAALGPRVAVAPHPEVASEIGSAPAAPNELVGVASRQLIASGLTNSGTRYQIEFRVGAAIWREPQLFREFGGAAPATREIVARTLARWLAGRNNGKSEEWTRSLRSRGVEGAIEFWTQRYLLRDSKGEAPVDRMRRAALAERDDCGLVAPADMTEILQAADELTRPGIHRYQLEVWTCSLLRAAKSARWHDLRTGRATVEGPGFLEVELLAAWMEGWPWGGGDRGSERAYVRHRSDLMSKGWIVPVSRPVWYATGPERPGEATRYRIRTPRPVRAAALPLRPDMVQQRIGGLNVNGRPLTIEEAYHALHVASVIRRLDRRYNRSIARRLLGIVEQISNPLGVMAQGLSGTKGRCRPRTLPRR